ncbi:MAG TPA: NIPSNAP family protein [Micromonosporaceae bacterium]|jgi:hypothetical protein
MILELRQYTLHPGARDVLIELFDREFVEGQEACGMTIFGQFRDLDNPDRFVWLRGFATMPARAEALARFYGGPVWKANAAAANATMIDSDDVLLLRPSTPRTGIPAPTRPRPPVGRTETPESVYVATISYRDRPFDDAFLDQLRPAGVCLQTEYAENTFPALPVRTGEHALVRLARFATVDDADAIEEPDLGMRSERLRLAPTARSLLR